MQRTVRVEVVWNPFLDDRLDLVLIEVSKTNKKKPQRPAWEGWVFEVSSLPCFFFFFLFPLLIDPLSITPEYQDHSDSQSLNTNPFFDLVQIEGFIIFDSTSTLQIQLDYAVELLHQFVGTTPNPIICPFLSFFFHSLRFNSSHHVQLNPSSTSSSLISSESTSRHPSLSFIFIWFHQLQQWFPFKLHPTQLYHQGTLGSYSSPLFSTFGYQKHVICPMGCFSFSLSDLHCFSHWYLLWSIGSLDQWHSWSSHRPCLLGSLRLCDWFGLDW